MNLNSTNLAWVWLCRRGYSFASLVCLNPLSTTSSCSCLHFSRCMSYWSLFLWSNMNPLGFILSSMLTNS